MFGIERITDGGFTRELIAERFATEEAAKAYMVAHDWDGLAERTGGEEGAEVVAL